jgi:hypothetical protein
MGKTGTEFQMSAYEKYREDLPEFIRGRLDVARAQEILKAAEDDEVLRAAIESERSLERWLDYYEVPEAPGLEGRFWQRFHEEKLIGGKRSLWLMKLVGPLAAAVLVAIGVIVFVNNGDEGADPAGNTPVADTETEAPALDVTFEDSEWDYLVGAPVPVGENGRGDKLDAEALATLRMLDNPAFVALDDLSQAEDLAVIDDLDLLTQLAEDE